MDYNVIVTVDSTESDEATTDRVLDALVRYSPAISWDGEGRMVVTITVSSKALDDQALLDAIHAVHRIAGPPINVQAMTTADYDKRVEEEDRARRQLHDAFDSIAGITAMPLSLRPGVATGSSSER